jgi:hypothetical protein
MKGFVQSVFENLQFKKKKIRLLLGHYMFIEKFKYTEIEKHKNLKSKNHQP